MSYDLVDATFVIGLPAIEKATLLALCRHAHADGGGAYPSVNTLSLETGLSERSVQKALRALEERNYISASTDKAGGRRSVTYRILIPNADVVAAVKSTWKKGRTSEGRTPNTPQEERGASHAPEGRTSGTAGVQVAHPNAVREEVKEEVKTPTTTGRQVGTVASSKTAGTPKADSVIAWFIKNENKAMPAGRKAKQELEQLLDTVPDAIGKAAIENWWGKRNFRGLEFPLQALLSELPAYIKLETEAAQSRKK